MKVKNIQLTEQQKAGLTVSNEVAENFKKSYHEREKSEDSFMHGFAFGVAMSFLVALMYWALTHFIK